MIFSTRGRMMKKIVCGLVIILFIIIAVLPVAGINESILLKKGYIKNDSFVSKSLFLKNLSKINFYNPLGRNDNDRSIGIVASEDYVAIPVACFFWNPLNPKPDETVTFDASCSYDPDRPIVEYYWSYTTIGSPHFPITIGYGIVLDYSWGNPGSYNVTLMVTNDYGEMDSVTKTVIIWFVENQPPTGVQIFGSHSGKPGAEYTYSFVASDPEGHGVSYFMNWGDGVTSGWTRYRESGSELSLSHIWEEEGVYMIKAKAKDIYDAEGEEGIFEVTMSKSKSATNLYDLGQRLGSLNSDWPFIFVEISHFYFPKARVYPPDLTTIINDEDDGFLFAHIEGLGSCHVERWVLIQFRKDNYKGIKLQPYQYFNANLTLTMVLEINPQYSECTYTYYDGTYFYRLQGDDVFCRATLIRKR